MIFLLASSKSYPSIHIWRSSALVFRNSGPFYDPSYPRDLFISVFKILPIYLHFLSFNRSVWWSSALGFLNFGPFYDSFYSSDLSISVFKIFPIYPHHPFFNWLVWRSSALRFMNSGPFYDSSYPRDLLLAASKSFLSFHIFHFLIGWSAIFCFEVSEFWPILRFILSTWSLH